MADRIKLKLNSETKELEQIITEKIISTTKISTKVFGLEILPKYHLIA